MYINKYLIKLSIILLSSLLLTGCKQEITQEYLMLHPDVLQKEFAKCQITQADECNLVMRAAQDLSPLVDEQVNDPESFGQRIMLAQRELDRLSIEYKKINQTQEIDKSKPAKEAYQNQYQKLQILYAVVALRSPE